MIRTLGVLATATLAATAIGNAAPAWAVPGEVLDGTYTLLSLRDGGTLDTWVISPQCGDEKPYLFCKASIRSTKIKSRDGKPWISTAEYVGGYDWQMLFGDVGNGNCGISSTWNGKSLTGQISIVPCDGGGGVFQFRMVKQ